MEYAPKQMMVVFHPLKDLSNNPTHLPKMEDTSGRNINDVCKRVADLETQKEA